MKNKILIIPICVVLFVLSFSIPDTHAQQLCADAVFTNPLPQSFPTGTTIHFTVNFGSTFSSINAITAYSFFDSTDPFDAGDSYFIDNFGGQEGQLGDIPQTETIINQIDPSVTNNFLDGVFSGSFSSERGSFILNKLTFCVQQPATFDVPPTPPNGTTFNIHTGDTLSFKIECSDPNPPDTISLSPFTELPVGAIFPVEVWPINFIYGNPVNGTFSWTPTIAQTTAVTFACEDQLSTTLHTINIVVTDVNPISVKIDINPKSFPNTFNPNSVGVIPVAILGSSTFDASTVIPSTIKFGPGMAPAIKPALLFDVNGDGKNDAVLNFKIQNTGIVCGQTNATLTGLTKAGIPIQGSDSIKPLPCK